MKKTIVLLAVLLAVLQLASATPVVYEVVVTPLYANAFNTLTCRYISNDSTATARYRFYDGHDGIFYDMGTTATYTSLSTGYEYNCSVNLTDATGSTGWYNSTNSVTVNASCLTQFPYYYVNTIGNISFNYTTDFYVVGGNIERVDDEEVRIENNTYIFFGGSLDEGGVTNIYMWNTENYMRGDTTDSGNFITNGSDTDEDYANYYYHETPMSTNQYSNYDDLSVPVGTGFQIKTGIYSEVGGITALVAFEFYNAGGWDVLYTHSTNVVAWDIKTENLTTTEEYTRIRIHTSFGAGMGTGNARIYEIEQLNYSSGLVDVTNNLTSFTASNFTLDGAFYVFNYLDEETRDIFNFSTGADLNESNLRIYCQSTITEISLDEDYNETYRIGVKEIPLRIETLLEYDDGSDYYRRMVFCDVYDSFDYYVVDAVATTPRLYTFTIQDQSGGTWDEGHIKLKRYVDTVLDIITGDEWDAAHQAMFYLIDNREYSITLVSDDCGSERNIGWLTTNPADTTLTLTVSGTDFNTTGIGMIYNNLYFNVYWNATSNRTICLFYDEEEETSWFWWGVYYAHNDSLAYSDNTTTHTYTGSYLANPAYEYYAKIIISHPDGSDHTYLEGGLNLYETFMEFLEWEGEWVLGLEADTFYLLFSLIILALTGLMVGPVSVGVGAFLISAETLTFSVIGWLPFLEGMSTGRWPFILATVFIITVLINYVRRGTQ